MDIISCQMGNIGACFLSLDGPHSSYQLAGTLFYYPKLCSFLKTGIILLCLARKVEECAWILVLGLLFISEFLLLAFTTSLYGAQFSDRQVYGPPKVCHPVLRMAILASFKSMFIFYYVVDIR